MATKSEDIKLQMNNVRYKKGDGTLYLMAERLGWMPNTKDNFTISHKYSDIKMQKISPEGKAKIQLQIVLHTGDNTTFQFSNLEDRTAVKDALLQILPLFKGKIPKDREKKALLLSKNPNLLQLYKDLVETKIVSAEDFWSQFVDEQSETLESQVEIQDVGVSADFLSGIPLNGKQVKGNVSVETLMAICKTFPRVAKKYQELVPTKMNEREFWNKFFQSRYFNRDRVKGDLFADCFKSDEKEWSSAPKRGVLDPYLDVETFNDNAYQSTVDEPPPSSSHDNPDQLLIKRFNQQSIRLLECQLPKKDATHPQPDVPKPTSSKQDSANGSDGQAKDSTASEDTRQDKQIDSEPITSYRANRRDWTYDDLAGNEFNGDFLDDQSKVGLRMRDVDREKYSILPQSQYAGVNEGSAKAHADALKTWNPNLVESISTDEATKGLKNFSPGTYLMKSINANRLENTVPEDLQDRLKSTYYASNELLRHFWLCFPAIEPSLQAKLVKIHETLKKFETTKLQSLYDSLPRDQRHLLNHIMRGQFKAAYRKFDLWKSKRSRTVNSKSTSK